MPLPHSRVAPPAHASCLSGTRELPLPHTRVFAPAHARWLPTRTDRPTAQLDDAGLTTRLSGRGNSTVREGQLACARVRSGAADEEGEDGGDEEGDGGGTEARPPVGADNPDQEVEGDQDGDGHGHLAATPGGELAGHQVSSGYPAGERLPPRSRPGATLCLTSLRRSPRRSRPLALRAAPGALLAHSVATQLRSNAAPASPDFSGWNCVALSGPFSTAATNLSPPCSLHVTSGARVRSLVWRSQDRTP